MADIEYPEIGKMTVVFVNDDTKNKEISNLLNWHVIELLGYDPYKDLVKRYRYNNFDVFPYTLVYEDTTKNDDSRQNAIQLAERDENVANQQTLTLAQVVNTNTSTSKSLWDTWYSIDESLLSEPRLDVLINQWIQERNAIIDAARGRIELRNISRQQLIDEQLSQKQKEKQLQECLQQSGLNEGQQADLDKQLFASLDEGKQKQEKAQKDREEIAKLENEAKNKKAKEEDKIRELRWNSQCFLMDWVDVFVGMHQPTRYGPSALGIGPVEDCVTQQSISGFDDGAGQVDAVPYTYKNFIMVTGKSSDLYSKLFVNRNSNILNSIPSSVFSLLTPKIKFYKVIYPGQFAAEGELPQQGEDIEILFGNHLDPRDLGLVTQNKGNNSSFIGLNDFQFERLASNYASVDASMRASLTLRMNSLRDLEPDDPKKPGVFNLILPPPGAVAIGADKNTYDDKFFRVKVIVGWSDLPENALKAAGVDAKLAVKIKQMLATNTTILWLTITRHNLSLNENGTIQLKAEYIAAVEAILKDPRANIFYDSITSSQISEIQKQIKALGSNEQKSAEQRNSELAPLQSQKAFLQQQIARRKYRDFVSRLLEKRRLLAVDVPKEQVGIWTERIIRPANLSSQTMGAPARSAQAMADLFRGADSSTAPDKYKEQITPSADLSKQRTAQRMEMAAGETTLDLGRWTFYDYKDFSVDAVVKPISDIQLTNHYSDINDLQDPEWRKSSLTPEASTVQQRDAAFVQNFQFVKAAVRDDQYRIYYMYFGDILEVLLDIFYENTKTVEEAKRDLTVLCGPMPITNEQKQETVWYNMSDIPIALDLFIVWFFERFVKGNLSAVYAFDFLQSLVTDLLISATGTKCFYGNQKQLPVFSAFHVTAPEIKFTKNPERQQELDKTKRIDLAELVNMQSLSEREAASQNFKNNKDLRNYYCIFATYAGSSQLGKRNEKRDLENGIVTLTIGAQMGIVKKISFNRIDFQYLQAAQNSKDDNSEIARIRDIYSADIQLIGNALFKPGQIVYLDVGYMNNGSANVGKKSNQQRVSDIAAKIGFAGYYLLTNVNTEIRDGSIMTNIKANWLADGTTDAKQDKNWKETVYSPMSPATYRVRKPEDFVAPAEDPQGVSWSK